MAKRQKKWARKMRAKLRRMLGGKCAFCSARSRLQFDVMFPNEGSQGHHEMEFSHRMSFYRKLAQRGELQLLCPFHNSSKGRTPDDEYRQMIGVKERELLIQGVPF